MTIRNTGWLPSYTMFSADIRVNIKTMKHPSADLFGLKIRIIRPEHVNVRLIFASCSTVLSSREIVL